MKLPRIKWRYYQDDNNRYVAQILDAKGVTVTDEFGASLTKEHLASVVREYHPHNICLNDATGLVI